MEWQPLFELIQVSALSLIVVLFLTGQIIPRYVVERFMLPPLEGRIKALEEALTKRDQAYQDLARQQASALDSTGRALERALTQMERGG